MSETRKAYIVREGSPPTLEEVTIVITPKRIEVPAAVDTPHRAYWQPNEFWHHYKGTPVDAWMKFLDDRRIERNELEERLAFAVEQIKAGEAYFDSISPFKAPSPEDFQS
jgi:hypothetical protein